MLRGKVAIVTGAGGGIGRAHALAFAREGAQVVVNDVGGNRSGDGAGQAAADTVVAEIHAQGGVAIANYDSVCEREGAEAIVQTALTHFGRLDILVNNAGILRDRTFLKMTEDEWHSVLRVHLDGTAFCSQAAALRLKAQGEGGRIINTTSLSGLLGNFGQANYAAAKGGIYSLTRTLALELASARITVNAIAPVALTRMTADHPLFQGVDEAAMGPQWVSPAVLFLASDDAAGLTGQVLGVHGPKLFVYRMDQTEGVTKTAGDGVWRPEEIRDAWQQISGEPLPT
jgi:NAD(P)-dependent dehydrogenase (short-subunit alcohol dehydrogenase family)